MTPDQLNRITRSVHADLEDAGLRGRHHVQGGRGRDRWHQGGSPEEPDPRRDDPRVQAVRRERNQPAYVMHTLAFVAELRGVPTRELGETVTANAERLFGWS